MKREDLKPGTLFRYTAMPLRAWAVDNVRLPGAPCMKLHTENVPDYHAEVTVVWAPPDTAKPYAVEGRRMGSSDAWKELARFSTLDAAYSEISSRKKAYCVPMLTWEYRVAVRNLDAVQRMEAALDLSKAVRPRNAYTPADPPREIRIRVPRGSLRPVLEEMPDSDIELLAEAAAEKTRRDIRKKEAAESNAREKRSAYLRSREAQAALTGLSNFLAGAAHAMAARVVLRWYAGHEPLGKGTQDGSPWQYWEVHDAAMDFAEHTHYKAPWLWVPGEQDTRSRAAIMRLVAGLQQRRRPEGKARSWGTGTVEAPLGRLFPR